ncbi:MAG: prealbumin-like fold domain-containing protein [Firmicutes bacterium]|nr:prealbumin-like fold domain-containing protein [Bacillota bacterium]
MKETNKTGTRFISCVLAVMMVVTALTGIFPATVSASTESGVGSEMWDNIYLDALAYTGYDVQAQKTNGDLFDTYASGATAYNTQRDASIYIKYGSGASGTETVSDSSTKTGYAPDLASFRSGGLVCASFVTYVLYNYLKNIKGIDVANDWGWTMPSGTKSPVSYYEMATTVWAKTENTTVITGYSQSVRNTSDYTKGCTFTATEDIPIGAIIFFNEVSDYSTLTLESSPAHIAIYAGEYNGKHFIIHVGNTRGPEITTIEGMSMANSADGKTGTPELVTYIIAYEAPEDEYGEIVVNKTDENGSGLSGAVFTATNTSTGDTYTIGPTNSSGYATSGTNTIPYGTYKVTETTMPSGYTEKDADDPWTVTVSDSTPTVTINAEDTGTKSLVILKQDEDGEMEAAE